MLPDYLEQAHDLCFLNHDVLVELLRSGEKNKIFFQEIEFSDDEDRKKLEASNDIFEWFEVTGRQQEHAEVLRRIVFGSPPIGVIFGKYDQGHFEQSDKSWALKDFSHSEK